MINQAKLFKHQIRNFLHTLFLFVLMSLILILLAYSVLGEVGTLWALLVSSLLLFISPKIPPQLIMKMYSGKLLHQSQAVQIHQIINELSRRAGLRVTPQIYYIPSQSMNAFSIGNQKNPAIGITEGLLNTLSARELIAVLAHEISHIYHNDMMVMGFADIINRVGTLLSLFGMAILCISLPFYFMDLMSISWIAICILIGAPLVLALLQLTLSRTREFSADIEAVSITGDAKGLAMALNKIKIYKNSPFMQIIFPRKNTPDPSVLRSHPKTTERIERLLSLDSSQIAKLDYQLYQQYVSPSIYHVLLKDPRWHIGGIWY